MSYAGQHFVDYQAKDERGLDFIPLPDGGQKVTVTVDGGSRSVVLDLGQVMDLRRHLALSGQGPFRSGKAKGEPIPSLVEAMTEIITALKERLPQVAAVGDGALTQSVLSLANRWASIVAAIDEDEKGEFNFGAIGATATFTEDGDWTVDGENPEYAEEHALVSMAVALKCYQNEGALPDV